MTRCLQATLPDFIHSSKLIYGLFVIVVIARTALLANNLPHLPRPMGFDAEAHQDYIRFIQDKHTLPFANEGQEMNQAPLYYLGSALLLDALGLPAGEDDAVIPLRAINGIAGLIHCWLALLCLRLLFPGNVPAQAVGLLVAAFLPPHLYLSQYVTNEPLAGLFVTFALYLYLLALKPEKQNLRLNIGIGLALGAAMLTKVSALLAVLLFLLAACLRLLSRRNYSPRDWLQSVGAITLSCAIVCGWYYGQIWMRFGSPIVGNWENNAGSALMVDPGFRTGGYYFNFGQIFVSPLFSGFHGFADGIYSTLWGDGLISGRANLGFRPPWNYDLMNAGYFLSLAISALFIAGFALTLFKLIRHPTMTWFVVIGLVSLSGIAIFSMTLHVTSYAQVKAFYGFPALIPFSALIAAGWNWLSQKGRIVRTALWVVVLAWAATAYATFWIRSSNFETYRIRGSYQAEQQHYAEAVESLSIASKLKPDDADTHYFLAQSLSAQEKFAEAKAEYLTALRLKTDSPDVLNNLAWLLTTCEKTDVRDGARAVQLAERACELTHYQKTIYIGTLAAAYAEAGRFDDAISTAQKACALAEQGGEQGLLQKNRELLELYRQHKAYHETAEKLVLDPK